MQSHPMRVCGLKLYTSLAGAFASYVTPYAGVWIETSELTMLAIPMMVTPYAGVWIETEIFTP